MATTDNLCVKRGVTIPADYLQVTARVRQMSAGAQKSDRSEKRPGPDLSCDWWFTLDPAPRFLVDGDGYLLSANPAGETALQDGQLAATSTGALKFGSGDCDARFLAGVRQVAGQGTRGRAVLRQRHGGWFAVDFHGAPGESLAVVGLREELAPSAQSMAAMAAAFQLTASELDVLHCLLSGRCPKTAAIDLHISEHTVRAHLRSIYAKMNARGISNTIRLSCTFL